ncbi:basic leucine zipper 9 [Daucus carota subsp. sativus]|uniref:BZIP domain-containing protein n=2 Tax=Daucus carota subsp. sativus TaxID=79200 RepID=A0A166FPC0_DAUCS|nr:PREDICTED: basic leucine zipper 9-like [Daucus carota subsp. sativus]
MERSNKMNKIPSEIDLEDIFNQHINDQDVKAHRPITPPGFADDAVGYRDDHPSQLPTFPFPDQEIMNGFSNCAEVTEASLWCQNFSAPKHSSISVTMDSQSSICAGSPTSAANNLPKGCENQAMGVTSGSYDQSDDDDIDTEAGPCEQSDQAGVRRIKRMVSNRESARRSRRRKQAHLSDLEQQVDQLRGENSTLFKNMTSANQQFKDATNNNRVLKSDVEALRAKVKLAEDMVTRGSLTSSITNIIQNHLYNTPQSFGTQNIHRMGNVSPTITVQRDDPSYPGLTGSGQTDNVDHFNGNIDNNIINDSVSCTSEIWPWGSHVPTMSK